MNRTVLIFLITCGAALAKEPAPSERTGYVHTPDYAATLDYLAGLAKSSDWIHIDTRTGP